MENYLHSIQRYLANALGYLNPTPLKTPKLYIAKFQQVNCCLSQGFPLWFWICKAATWLVCGGVCVVFGFRGLKLKLQSSHALQSKSCSWLRF